MKLHMQAFKWSYFLLYYVTLSSLASICAPLSGVIGLVIHNWWSNNMWSSANSQVASQLLSETAPPDWAAFRQIVV